MARMLPSLEDVLRALELPGQPVSCQIRIKPIVGPVFSSLVSLLTVQVQVNFSYVEMKGTENYQIGSLLCFELGYIKDKEVSFKLFSHFNNLKTFSNILRVMQNDRYLFQKERPLC